MDIMAIIAWIAIGLIAGWVAGMLTGHTRGMLGNLVLGLIGAFVGGLIGGWLFGWSVTGFNFGSILLAIVGAVLAVLALRLIPGVQPLE